MGQVVHRAEVALPRNAAIAPLELLNKLGIIVDHSSVAGQDQELDAVFLHGPQVVCGRRHAHVRMRRQKVVEESLQLD
jgi:hypothetical protein